MKLKRGSGVLMHITSLPGANGIGELGKHAYAFIDFLADAAQRYWQFLPVGPVSPAFGHSPYTSLSAFAGNPLLIDPDELVETGLLPRTYVEDRPAFSEYYVEFEKVIPYKERLLESAFTSFQQGGATAAFEEFCRNEEWLDDFALYMALREENEQRLWSEWPRDVAVREEKALHAGRKRLADRILYHKFVQFCFFRQWEKLQRYAAGKGVALIGDMPIYVGLDSADVWAHQDCFKLNPKTLAPTHVAGVPPDYFSSTGQRWGNPIYRWTLGGKQVNQRLCDWWQERFRKTYQMMDIVRIDHFRGFESYWEVPEREKTAVKGRWVKGPGKAFFRKMAEALGELPVIAEDLGIITPAVEKLCDALGFPGMKVLQFAFDSDENNLYLPHNYQSGNCVVYTGTHDNDTTLGWYYDAAVPWTSKERAMRYANKSDGGQIHWDFIKMAFSSIAATAIVPMQDILGFGGDCRMNRPSTSDNNWRWRCAQRFMEGDIGTRLRDETIFYKRA